MNNDIDDISSGKELNQNEIKYNDHSTKLSQFALCLLKGNDKLLSLHGAREIISMYPIIPYISKNSLIRQVQITLYHNWI